MQAFHSSIVPLCWTLQVEGIAQVALGSSVAEANELGQVISYEEYYPYGSSAYQVSSSSADLSLKRYRFTGKERDEETGLDHFGLRYYASWLGRWTSGDPRGFVDGLNLYRYVRNNPVNGIDNEGYSTQLVGDPFLQTFFAENPKTLDNEDVGRDEQGNIIFTPYGEEKMFKHYGFNEETQTGYVYYGIEGSVLSNEGTEINVRLVLNKEVYRVEDGIRNKTPLEEYCASPNCTGLAVLDSDSIVLNAFIVDEILLREEGFEQIGYSTAYNNPSDQIIGLYVSYQDKDGKEQLVAQHAEVWTGEMKFYEFHSEDGYFEYATLPEVRSKGGIKKEIVSYQGKTWKNYNAYVTYTKTTTDVKVNLSFNEEGSSHGVRHGVYGKIRVVSSDDFFKSQEEIRGITNLLDYKR